MSDLIKDWLLKIAILGLCAAALLYCSVLTLAVLASKGTTFKDFDAPAWIQAIGSVIGIAAGAAAVWWQSWRQDFQQKRQVLEAERTALEESSVLFAVGRAQVEILAMHAQDDLTYRLALEYADGDVGIRRVLEQLQVINTKALSGIGVRISFATIRERLLQTSERWQADRVLWQQGRLPSPQVHSSCETYRDAEKIIKSEAEIFSTRLNLLAG